MAGILACGSLLLPSAPQAKAVEGGFTPPAATDMAQIWLKGVDGNPDQFACSGVVTGVRWILTAQHCFKFAPYYEFFVRVGSTTLGQGGRYNVAGAKFRNDLAVLETLPADGHLPGYPYAKLAPNKKVPLRKQLDSYGWGKTCETCGPSPVLKGAHTKVIDNEEGLKDSAGGPAYKVRALKARLRQGDSGGPSGYWDGKVRVVTGVTSTSVVNGDNPSNAHMAQTYDDPLCAAQRNCVHDWLRQEARMEEYVPHDDLKLASILRDGPPTESVDRFRVLGWERAGRVPECR
ncbi:trypsin-like serine protease, partial [Streptomyces sp. NPDC008313]|uniref:trypsin-like serine protease n=1 Tax=Streptomyces sp. NPDC008313 TaxID=3364826 RepID=UPI0036EDF316